LLEKIKVNISKFYETYGMTETVTHVAVRQLQSKVADGESYFKALEHVNFEQDDRQCLIIHAPKLAEFAVVTNDIVDLKSQTSFNLLGRFDNVVNSGGVKLFPEQIEQKLQPVIDERFIIASEEDATLGEKLILIVENPRDSAESIGNRIKYLKGLTKFEVPKEIYTIAKFKETVNGKIQRKETIKAIIG
jgi:O-succinylbenzoic acid--CoA ligase